MEKKYDLYSSFRYLNGLIKLSLMIAVFIAGTSAAHAQWGETVTVSNNAELIQAMDNPNVEEIVLKSGHYDYFDQYFSEDVLYIKSGTMSNRGSCTYSISGADVCLDNAWTDIFLEVTSTGPVCSTTGQWQENNVEAPTGTASWTFDDINTLSTTVSVNTPGVWKFRFWWDPLPGQLPILMDINIQVFDKPEVSTTADDVCGKATTLVGTTTNTYGTLSYAWTVTAGPVGYDNPGNVTITTETAKDTGVEVFEYGQYTFQLAVTNGVCAPVTSTVTVDFFDIPQVAAAAIDDEVCGFDADLVGTVTNTHGTPTYAWSVIEGPAGYNTPGNVTITTATAITTAVEVFKAGEYTFRLAVTNGECATVSATVTVDFFDVPTNVQATGNADVCGTSVALTGSYTVVHGTPTYNWSLLDGPSGGNATFTPPNAKNTTAALSGPAIVYGTYTFVFAVTNSPCSTVTTTVAVTFSEPPALDIIGDDIGLCVGSTPYDLALNVSPPTGTFTFEVNGTVTDTFDPVEVGQYLVIVTATAGACTVSDTFTIHVYPEPKPDIDGPATVYTGSTHTYFVEPIEVNLDEGLFEQEAWKVEPEGAMNIVSNTMTISASAGDPTTASITALCGGELSFDWGWATPPAPGAQFYFAIGTATGTYVYPDPVGSFSITLSAGETIELSGWTNSAILTPVFTISNFEFKIAENYLWTIDDGGSGDVKFVGAHTGKEVEVKVDYPFVGTYTLTVEVDNCAACIVSDTFTVEVLPIQLVGQLKYYNAAETPMPTPFKTNYHGMEIPDYFWVMLLTEDEYNTWTATWSAKTWTPTLALFDQMKDLGRLKKVEELYGTDYVEQHPLLPGEAIFEAAFAFGGDIATKGSYTPIELDPDEQYYIFVWDGGYLDEPGQVPEAPIPGDGGMLHSWTWNNWGGVNATDALLIQRMATGQTINLDHIDGLPTYNDFAVDVADVNGFGGITTLDALLTVRRSIGLPIFQNFKYNFAVAGLFVDSIDFNTNNIFGDFANKPIDIPFDKFQGLAPYQATTSAFAHIYAAPLTIDPNTYKPYLNIYYNAVGDINSSYFPSNTYKEELDMELFIDGELGVSIGDEVTIPINVTKDAEIGALSIGLNYRNDLVEVVGTNYGEDFAFFDHKSGILRIGFFTTSGMNLLAGDEIATITLRVLGEIPSGTAIFELDAFTELANVNAQVIHGIDLQTISLTTDVVSVIDPAVDALSMMNFPNPFHSNTTISYNLPEMANVRLVVFNNMGQVVRTLVDTNQDAGSHEVTVNSGDLSGPGIYYYRIEAKGAENHYSATNSMVLIR